ncbi:murein biosynthesis integral membrane protein MurJ [Halioxenophilus aromaticivorans]|uniref:Probable lipid II flippase MurJ n=1 Tax=Halioxenophilus aromaticivorans TaxID=1306992 RepID=A0AAV3TYG0_9ALTE
MKEQDKYSQQERPKRERGLLRASSLVGVMTFMSRILGLVRDVCFARYLGAEASADAFYIAFKIPNFFRRLFAEGAFSQAFVPVLSEYRSQGSHAAVQLLINNVAGVLGLSLLAFTLLAVAFSPVVAFVFAPGYTADPVKFGLVADLLRITFPYLLLISLTGFAGGILNSYDRFAVPALTPVWLNVVLITAAVAVAPSMAQPAYALAWGVFLAGVVQMVFQLPFLARLSLLPKPSLDHRHPGVRKIFKLMLPAIFGVSVSQINLLLDTVLASLLPTGSVSWLYYSDRLSELPLGVFAVAIGTVILPKLSRLHAQQAPEKFSQTLDWALRTIILIAVPAALALVVVAEPILTTLFQYGKTSAHDIAMASFSLRAYALGLVAFMLIKVLAPGFYARQDTKTPVKIGVVAMVANMVLNVIFVAPLYFWFNLGHMGLALATAASAFLNAWLLLRGLRSAGIYTPQSGWWRVAVQQVVSNALMCAILLAMLVFWGDWSIKSTWQRVWQLVAVCGLGFTGYLVGLVLTGFRARHLRPSS